MRELLERAYFFLCLTLGRLLRSSRYSKVRIVQQGGELQVRKHRLFHAPLLVWLGVPLVKVLDAGMRVLPQRDWQERERMIYQSLHGTSARIDAGGILVLPHLPGKTLADWLEDPELEHSLRKTAIELAVISLARFHQLGFTHADAMAENVLIDVQAGVAHWVDFETIHDSHRSMAWRRADDLRALLATCLLRTAADQSAEILQLILDVYPDHEVTALLAQSFASVLRRPLTFHLGQAGLSFRDYRKIASLLKKHAD